VEFCCPRPASIPGGADSVEHPVLSSQTFWMLAQDLLEKMETHTLHLTPPARKYSNTQDKLFEIVGKIDNAVQLMLMVTYYTFHYYIFN